MTLQIDRMFFPTKALGYGSRLAIWTIGCPHHCANCSNPELWAENPDKDIPVSDIIKAIKPHLADIDGITITGGEPFSQIDELLMLLREIKSLGINDILVYTGYRLEQLSNIGDLYDEALSLIGVLIDGEYVDGLNDNKGIRGSSNQQIYVFYPELIEKYKNCEVCERTAQTLVINAKLSSIGIPLK